MVSRPLMNLFGNEPCYDTKKDIRRTQENLEKPEFHVAFTSAPFLLLRGSTRQAQQKSNSLRRGESPGLHWDLELGLRFLLDS